MSRIRVPLAVDAQLRIPLGPVQLPVPTCIGLAAATPLISLVLVVPLPFGLRLGLGCGILAAATALSAAGREGVWIGTWVLARALGSRVPAHVRNGAPVVVPVPPGLRHLLKRIAVPRRLAELLLAPRVMEREDGLLRLEPGGWRAVLSLEGPAAAMESATYRAWCDTVVRWLGGLGVPAQFLTTAGHVDRERAEAAFDAGVTFPDGPLRRGERDFAAQTAETSLAFTHHVVLAPHLCNADGLVPRLTQVACARVDAENALRAALSAGRAAGLRITATDTDSLATLLRGSALGAERCEATSDGVVADGVRSAALAVTGLGPDADFGMLVDAVQRSSLRGAVSLHLLPVQRASVRTALQRRRLWLRYALREGRPDIDLEVSLGDTEQVQAEIAAGRATGVRIAVSLRAEGDSADAVAETVRTLRGILLGHGWRMECVTQPRLLPAWITAPGVAPLRRATLLTTDAVAARLLPALGTPFTAVGDPLVGVNLRTGASAYLSVLSRSNFNTVIVGSSGAGKSATAKTFLIRHVLRGAGACIVDPDSEYRGTVQLLGGTYHDLADASLNPLAIGGGLRPDAAASRIVPVLSVMAGDEIAYAGGRPIRRLAAEDKAVLHQALRSFLAERGGTAGEPLLHEFVAYLEKTVLKSRSLATRSREELRRIALRLEGYTHGELGRIFDRPTSFAITPGSVTGIGFQSLSLAYAADLTPALCVVLSHLLDAITVRPAPMLVMVDEAHVLTADPDAGQVLEQLVRRARKCRAGVWMASQKIEEFTATELGRTLASTAATKVVLGHEDTVAARVRSLFDLADDEALALTPPVPGRAVLIAGSERTVVQVQPSPVIWPFVVSGVPDEETEAEETVEVAGHVRQREEEEPVAVLPLDTLRGLFAPERLPGALESTGMCDIEAA